jgi:hypothetical protein
MQFKNPFKSLFQKSKPKVSFKFLTDIPEHLADNTIYIIGERAQHWLVIFYCPCGCRETISLNLLKETRPRWRFITRWSQLTLYPSVWRTVGCKSHFNVKKNKIVWCNLDY